LVRPWILAGHSGLLDRNLPADHGEEEKLEIPASSAMTALLGDKRINLWVPAAAGWSVGTVVLVIWRTEAGHDAWVFVVPIAGMLLAPPAWCLFRLSIFSVMEGFARKKR
jgi:hypothetical protein